MKVVDFLRPDLVIPELKGRSKSEVLAEMAKRREALQVNKNDHVLSCPLCMAFADLPPAATATGIP